MRAANLGEFDAELNGNPEASLNHATGKGVRNTNGRATEKLVSAVLLILEKTLFKKVTISTVASGGEKGTQIELRT